MEKYFLRKRNHWWIDSGIAGIYYIINEYKDMLVNHHIKMSSDEKRDTLVFEYSDKECLRAFFLECYNKLAEKYWNVSTSKQRETKELVIYDKESGQLNLAAKRTPTPVASLFVGARSWRGDGIPYNDMDEELRLKVDSFLKENNRSLWGSKKILLFQPPVCHQQINILPIQKTKKNLETCCICGIQTPDYSEVGLPSYLLFASNSAAKSFNSQAQSPAKICWECDFLAKFALEAVNYKKTKTDLYIIQAYSPNLERLVNIQKTMGAGSFMRKIDDSFFWSNIKSDKNSLVSKSDRPYELLWAFFYDIFDILNNESTKEESNSEGGLFLDFISEIHSFPLQVYLMHTSESGDTFITRELIIYQDTGYAFRLLDHLKDHGIDIKLFFNCLWDSDRDKDQNLVREKVLRNVLKKRSVLDILEEYCFKKIINQAGFFNIAVMLEFVRNYEPKVREDCMDKTQIETAVNLGKQIVISATESVQEEIQADKSKKENLLKKLRGDLFTLRKTRTKTDFLTQLNNLQFRYGIAVSNEILSGILEQVDYEEFKAYCIMGALNSYSFEMSKVRNNSPKEGK